MRRSEETSLRRQVRARTKDLRQKILAYDLICLGTLHSRTKVCGQPSCRCQEDIKARHGPYHEWTRYEGGKLVHSVSFPRRPRQDTCADVVPAKTDGGDQPFEEKGPNHPSVNRGPEHLSGGAEGHGRRRRSRRHPARGPAVETRRSEEPRMFEAQLLLKGSSGTAVHSPWFPRQGDSVRCTLDVVSIGGAGTVTVTLFTKKSEDTWGQHRQGSQRQSPQDRRGRRQPVLDRVNGEGDGGHQGTGPVQVRGCGHRGDGLGALPHAAAGVVGFGDPGQYGKPRVGLLRGRRGCRRAKQDPHPRRRERMFEAQYLPAPEEEGFTVLSPWFPRQGDRVQCTVDVVGSFGFKEPLWSSSRRRPTRKRVMARRLWAAHQQIHRRPLEARVGAEHH